MTREEAKNILTSILHTDGDYMDYLDREDVEAIKFLASDERPHGEWGKKTFGYLSTHECSECGFDGNRLWHFCPNCGADMRVKGELNRVNKELNSEIEKSKSEIVPDYRDGWRLKEGEAE